jgi:hypothetical protein
MASAAAGCGEGSGAVEQDDPWGAAGVDKPRVSEGSGGALSVSARTDLPLEDAKNQVGFGERIAKIAWRTHPGRVTSMRVAISDKSGHSNARSWRRTDLESAFGPRLGGLDQGHGVQPTRGPKPGKGPYSGKKARDAREGAATLAGLLRTTGKQVFGVDGTPVEGERTECTGGLLDNKPNGKLRVAGTLEAPLPGGTHEIVPLTRLATYWSGLGLRVDTSGLFDGNDDIVRATASGLGRLSASAERRNGRMLLFAQTECLKP